MQEVIIDTPLGQIVGKRSDDPAYPGIYIDLRRPGCNCDAPLAMAEATSDVTDHEEGTL